MLLEPRTYSIDEYQDIAFKCVPFKLDVDVLNIINDLEQIITQSMSNASSELGDKFSKKSFESVPFNKYIEKKGRFIKHEKKPIISIENIDDWNSGKSFKIAPKL